MPGSNGNADYWDLKRNTQVTHDILSSYLLRWASILSGARGDARRLAFHYVDGFAGRGRYSSEEPGSPLIAMEIGQELYELIDPFGPKGVELDEVMRFLVRRRSEVFIMQTNPASYLGINS